MSADAAYAAALQRDGALLHNALADMPVTDLLELSDTALLLRAAIVVVLHARRDLTGGGTA